MMWTQERKPSVPSLKELIGICHTGTIYCNARAREACTGCNGSVEEDAPAFQDWRKASQNRMTDLGFEGENRRFSGWRKWNWLPKQRKQGAINKRRGHTGRITNSTVFWGTGLHLEETSGSGRQVRITAALAQHSKQLTFDHGAMAPHQGLAVLWWESHIWEINLEALWEERGDRGSEIISQLQCSRK